MNEARDLIQFFNLELTDKVFDLDGEVVNIYRNKENTIEVHDSVNRYNLFIKRPLQPYT